LLSEADLRAWCNRLGLSARCCEVVADVRSRPPTRRVGGGRSNVSGRYPSRKMGATIQFESHRVELPIIYELEHDPSVLEYYDQPPSIPLVYESGKGKRLSVIHTPDFFVVRADAAGWEECKTEQDLEKLGERSPNRYHRDSNGSWQCTPGERYAKDFGLYYRIRSSATINWTLQHNLQYLEDYFRCDGMVISRSSREAVTAEIAGQPGLSLTDLIQRTKDAASRDDIYFMIATGEIFADLSASAVAQPAEVAIFANAELAAAFRLINGSSIATTTPLGISAEPGQSVSWDGTPWRIVNVGDSNISLLGANSALTELPRETFDRLLSSGALKNAAAGATTLSDAARILNGASETDLRDANRRFDLVKRHINGESLSVPARTIRFWTALYRAGQEKYGSGYLGLLPRVRFRGNRTARFSQDARALTEQWIANDYESLKQRSKRSSWALLKARCEDQNLTAPSYKTFCRWVRSRPVFEQTLKRQGPRAAYAHGSIYLELTRTTPRHGDRPFEIGHIDHTELDVELVCSLTGRPLGRPWLTLLMDAFSRRGLAFYLTFDPPSYRSCMMILRECVRRNGRFPQIVVIDGGAEFQSTYFETLLARYECIKKTRPPAKARFGSVCERLFGTTNTQFIHNLRGNTQITRNVRQVTQSVNPKGLATWTLGDLHDQISEYLHEVYDTIDHPALGQSPGQAFQAGLEAGGFRLQRMIPYDQEFLIATLPTTPKGTAVVAVGRGVKINHLYYWSDTFREPGVENEVVPVRYDPFDFGTAYAFVRNQWVVCRSEHFAAFEGRSEKEVMIASREIHKRRQEHSRNGGITARRLADFLLSVESEEALLQQRLRDRQSTAVRGGNVTERPPLEAVEQGPSCPSCPDVDPERSDITTDLQAYAEF
jgi:putative transposase